MFFKKGAISKGIVVLLSTVLACVCAFSGCSVFEDLFGEEETTVDFVVEVEDGRNPIVLQLTDTQIIDSSQQRTSGRLDAESEEYWAKDKKEDRCYKYVREVVNRTNPDLIILTGDIIYGEFDDDGSCFTDFVAFMESFEIPWAPVFGNHDNESTMGVDWQCEQFENAEHCLFKQRELYGNGNYSVGIKQNGKIVRAFYMLDSNGCGSHSAKSFECGHFKDTQGFGQDQIDWYNVSIQELKAKYPDVKISFAFHIQIGAFMDALQEKYDFYGKPLDLDKNGVEGDFGYVGYGFSSWDANGRVWANIKELGVDSIFVGHEHSISSSVVYEGVRLQFGQKSSTYDAICYRGESNEIVVSSVDAGMPIVGGTVIEISHTDASIHPYIVLCEKE